MWERRRSGSGRMGGSAGAGLLLLSGCAGQEWGALSPRGSQARDLYTLFWVMTALGAAVFVLVLVVLFRARGGAGDESETQRERRSTRLVLGGGVVLPVVVLVPLVIYMLVVADRLSPRLGEAEEIRVVGHLFWWEVEYPDADVVTANEIHLPVGTRIRVLLATADVIHSFWVPQLAGKVDMIPGEQTEVVIEVDEPGVYLGYCAEFCGVQHARMRLLVVAHEPADFEEWLAAQAEPAAAPVGEAAQLGAGLFAEYGCAACHRVRGTEADGEIGPDLTHIASRRTLGAVTVANERGQLSGWIANSHAVKPGNLMPPIPISGQDLQYLLAYLEGLE